MEKYNVSNKSAQEARYHESANDMCFIYFGTSTATSTPVRKGREHERMGHWT